jgi:ubiquinone/menaquinone biosynthesis C-methylase UbiE
MAREPKQSKADRRFYKLVERTVDVALAVAPVPLRVLDVDCGEGEYLRELIERVPYGTEYVGVDLSDDALRFAREDSDARLTWVRARPDALPFPDAHFDLVVSGMGFRQWQHQSTALHQMARVLTDSGKLVIVDRVRPGRIVGMIEQTGLRIERRETVSRNALALPRVMAYVAGL